MYLSLRKVNKIDQEGISVELTVRRLENGLILVIAAYLFLIYGTSWAGFFIFIMLPALSHLPARLWKKAENSRLCHLLHRLVHSYFSVVMIWMFLYFIPGILLWSLLGWIIHIAIERVIS